MPKWGKMPLIAALSAGGGMLAIALILALTPIGFAVEIVAFAAVIALLAASLACAVLTLNARTDATKTVHASTPKPVRTAVLRGQALPEGAEPQAVAWARSQLAMQTWSLRQMLLLGIGLVGMLALNGATNEQPWLLWMAVGLGIVYAVTLPTQARQLRHVAARAAA